MIDIVEDQEFWARLECFASGWLMTSSEKEHRRCWIDGFVPSAMRRTNAAAEVTGTAWVMRKDACMQCDFLATIPWRIVNRARVEFEIAHIQIDLERKALEVVLRRAVEKPTQALEPAERLAPRSRSSET